MFSLKKVALACLLVSSTYGGDVMPDKLVKKAEKVMNAFVENMQIQYGLDNNADRDVDEYQAAALVTDWKAVISIRMSLLLASENSNLVKENTSYSFDENTLTFTKDASPTADANKKLHRSFTGMTALRNRTL